MGNASYVLTIAFERDLEIDSSFSNTENSIEKSISLLIERQDNLSLDNAFDLSDISNGMLPTERIIENSHIDNMEKSK